MIDADAKKILEEIALTELSLTTLDVRDSDSLDFHDCYVGSIRAALEAAFQAGREYTQLEVHTKQASD